MTPTTDEQIAQELAEQVYTAECAETFQSKAKRVAAIKTLLIPLVRDSARWRWWRQRWAAHVVTFLFGNGCVDRTIEDADAAIDRARSKT